MNEGVGRDREEKRKSTMRRDAMERRRHSNKYLYKLTTVRAQSLQSVSNRTCSFITETEALMNRGLSPLKAVAARRAGSCRAGMKIDGMRNIVRDDRNRVFV